jgi:group I intron endonuclease
MTGIYKITNPVGKIYIGKAANIEKRLRDYSTFMCAYQPLLYISIGTYGWINHTKEIVEECTIEKLDEREKFWIDYYNTKEDGLNKVTRRASNVERKSYIVNGEEQLLSKRQINLLERQKRIILREQL